MEWPNAHCGELRPETTSALHFRHVFSTKHLLSKQRGPRQCQGPLFATAAKPGGIIDSFLRQDGQGSRAAHRQTIHFHGSGSLLKGSIPFRFDSGLIVRAGLVGHIAGQLNVQLILRNLRAVIQLEGYLLDVIFTLVDAIDDCVGDGDSQRFALAVRLNLIVRLAISVDGLMIQSLDCFLLPVFERSEGLVKLRLRLHLGRRYQ